MLEDEDDAEAARGTVKEVREGACEDWAVRDLTGFWAKAGILIE